MEAQGGHFEHKLDLSPAGDGMADELAQRSGGTDQPDEEFGLGLIGDDIGCAAAVDGADVQGGGAEFGIGGPGQGAYPRQSLEELFDGGIAELGIGGVGGAAPGAEGEAEHTLAGRDHFAFGGLAVDEVTDRARGAAVGGEGAGAIALFARDEEQTEIAATAGEQGFGGKDLGGDNAFGVAGTAAMDVGIVFAAGNEGRNGVEMGAEHDAGLAAAGEEVEAEGRILALERPFLDLEAGQSAQMLGDQAGGRGFAAGGRVHVHQGTGEGKEAGVVGRGDDILGHMACITTGTFPGPAGKLEYILNEPAGPPPRHAAVVCHPHPLYGGTMHTKIVFQTAQTLMQRNAPVLRFHFRGVGKSEGQYDHGRGELEDLAAALAFLRQRYPLPLTLAGFSFGATMVAKILTRDFRPEIERAVLLGLPVEARDRGEIPSQWRWRGPKLMLSGAQDQFAGVAALEAYFAALEPPKWRRWIEGGDHFLTGHMEAYRQALAEGLEATA